MTATQRDDLLIEMATDVKGLQVAITGNGTKGLGQRMDECEAKKTPSLSMILKRRGIDVAIMGVIFAGINLAGKAAGIW